MLASCADFDTKRKIKRQTGNWVHFSFGWVQNAQNKTGGDCAGNLLKAPGKISRMIYSLATRGWMGTEKK